MIKKSTKSIAFFLKMRRVLVIALQRPLFQDGNSGIVDSLQIQSILQELIHQMIRVRVSISKDPVLYEAYIIGIETKHPPPRLFLKWRGTETSLKSCSPVVVSFVFNSHAYFFEIRVIEPAAGCFSLSFPEVLESYPPRALPRLQYPLAVPISIEFPDPWAYRGKLVRELDDIGYDGLSYRTSPEDRPPASGLLISRIDLFLFDQPCYSTSAKVLYVRPCSDFQGKRFHRVGAVFQERERPPLQGGVFFKENECEEIIIPSKIKICLRKLTAYKAPAYLQDAAQKRPVLYAVPEEMERQDLSLLSFRIEESRSSRVRFAVGRLIRVHYIMDETLYLFLSSVCRSETRRIILKIPERMIQIRRRKTLRCIPPQGEEIRIHFKNPLLDQDMVRPVLDLSETGLSISLDLNRNFLFAGMRIHDALLNLNGRPYPLPRILIQSVKTIRPHRGRLCCRIGISFEYLPDETRQAVLDILRHERHPFQVESGEHLIPGLWSLHYQSGFIYPEKHDSIMEMKKEIDRTWKRLYSEGSQFFINFALVHDEKVLGSGSILQVYEETWLLQHLSALKHPLMNTGKEINLGLAEELFRNHEIHYIKTYFRPDNPWPNKNFRAFAEEHLKPQEYDLTRYRLYHRHAGPIPTAWGLPAGVEVGLLRNPEQEMIRNYFAMTGKALYARSESLFGHGLDLMETSRLYRMSGLRRNRRIFAVRRGQEVLCFSVAEDTSVGVNLSGLLNHFRIYIVSRDREIVDQVLPFLVNEALSFYRSFGYSKVTLMTFEPLDAILNEWGFSYIRDYYCLTYCRQSIFQYQHYVREKYGKLECRMLRMVKYSHEGAAHQAPNQ
ncbi:MAG: hypothetical protein COZ32_09400 [Nitrospirae bacterium CG_4_10_14_3_um_filter_53_41]|nr:MAG: hypothetical protein COZ32_09400 [Nitrospirae bacterium CG_4_10_14_3_um_filter_53_41]